jgi:hypothetical protein
MVWRMTSNIIIVLEEGNLVQQHALLRRLIVVTD